MVGKSYLVAKHPKRSKLAITDIREEPVKFFLLYDKGVNFSARNNLVNLGFFAKVSLPVQLKIPWVRLIRGLYICEAVHIELTTPYLAIL